MATWVLVPSLVSLREELNALAPNRDKSSDGTIGDPDHAAGGTSDHLPDEQFPALRGKDADKVDEVHALDVDEDLKADGLTMEMIVQHLLRRCRTGQEKRLRYIIFDRRIWEASNDWEERAYSGPNPHDKHAHFSASYESAREASTASWGLRELKGSGEDEMLVRKGDSGQAVTYAQYLLKELGYAVGDIDGEYGEVMQAAVNAYRKNNGAATGATMVTGWQLFHMQRALAVKYAGEDGKPGMPGQNGRDGKDGAPGPAGPAGRDAVLSGSFTVTGGQLTMEAGA